MSEPPWEHPDWYDLHDAAFSAGVEREPEHYRELLLAVPPLDAADHLLDVGAGTGKVAATIARAYPELGRVTLLDPNRRKLQRAVARVSRAFAGGLQDSPGSTGSRDALSSPGDRVVAVEGALGDGALADVPRGTLATVGSVFMPIMEMRGGTLREGLAWLDAAIREVGGLLEEGGTLLAAETIGLPWSRGTLDGPVRRLQLPELVAALERGGFVETECTYRFRDRVVLRAVWCPQRRG